MAKLEPSKLSPAEPFKWLGECQPGTVRYNELNAEIERRKYNNTLRGTIIAVVAVVIAAASFVFGNFFRF